MRTESQRPPKPIHDLRARRQVILHELVQVNHQIAQVQKEMAQVEQRRASLVAQQRQAA